MGYINKKNKIGAVSAVGPLLKEGELGIDLNVSNGDSGRVWVGDGTVNIPLAKKGEVDALDTRIVALETAPTAVIDAIPTDGSVNLVSSNGVFDAVYEAKQYAQAMAIALG